MSTGINSVVEIERFQIALTISMGSQLMNSILYRRIFNTNKRSEQY